MRKALLIVVLVIMLAIAGVAVAFFTVDINQFRPLAVAKLREATGRQVTLAAMHRSWAGGLGIELQGLVIPDDPRFGTEPLVSVERASARVKLAPLLQRKLEIAAITLEHPVIRVVKDAAGQLNVPTLGSSSAPAHAPTASSSSSAALPLLVTALTVRAAQVSYRDLSTTPPLTADMKDADITISHISVVNGAPAATLALRNATLTSSRLNRPIDGMMVDARVTPDNLELTKASALVGNGTVDAHGSVQSYRATPVFEGDVTVHNVLVQDLVPAALAHADQHVEGKLSGHVQVRGQGRAWPAIQPTLAGDVDATVTGGRLTNFNLLREALTQLSIVPGVMERLEAKLPERHRQLLQQRDTALQDVHLRGQIAQGAFLVDPLLVTTDVGMLQGRGRLGLDGSVELPVTITVPPDLSATIIASVKELHGLADPHTHAITFPLTLVGELPRLAVRLNLDYIAQRVLVSQGTELIDQLLNKALGGKDQPAPTTSTPSEPSADQSVPAEQLLHDLFKKKKKP